VRAQVVAPRARRIPKSRGRKKSAFQVGKALKSAALFIKPVMALVLFIAAIVGYRAFANSSLFELRRVMVSGASESVKADIEVAVRQVVGGSKLLEVELADLQKRVESVARVKSATVARALPDGIFVSVLERQPLVVARRKSEALMWLDEDGLEIGDYWDSSIKAPTPWGNDENYAPPVVKGFSEGSRSQAAVADDRERIELYRKIERELNDGPTSLWSRIDQIDLTYTRDANLHLSDPPVKVHVGDSDFRKRLEKALAVLAAATGGDAERLMRLGVSEAERLIENASGIHFIDAARGDRIVVNFATPGVHRRQEKRSDE
jgi:hypothetical protein